MRIIPLILALSWPALLFGAPPAEPEEAKPLDVPAAVPATPAAPEARGRHRGYILAEGSRLIDRSGSADSRNLSALEANLSGSYDLNPRWRAFGDVTANHYRDNSDDNVVVNQLGISGRSGPWQWMAGKERSRKAPGLVVSPSDFLYRSENLPGLREQRQGVWQARLSWQTIARSADVLWLPNVNVDDHGLTDADRRRRGWALRWFRQNPAADVGLNYARLEGDHLIGGWAQTYVHKTTKLYLDTAWLQTDTLLNRPVENNRKLLAGLSLEHITDTTIRAELLYNHRGLEGDITAPTQTADLTNLFENIFYRRRYAIASISRTNLWRESSFTLNVIRALGDPERVVMVRYDLPVTSSQTVGATLGALRHLPVSSRATLATFDWKYTF